MIPLYLGGVSEWLMEHAWKACMRDKRIVGSNPTSSAFISRFVGWVNYFIIKPNSLLLKRRDCVELPGVYFIFVRGPAVFTL